MSAVKDRPDIAERYASATSSGDLTPRLKGVSDADVLLAAGMATCKDPSRRGLALACYRMSVRGDMRGLAEVVEAADGWLLSYLSRGGRRPLKREVRRQLIVDTLTWWVTPTCGYCGGTGFVEALVQGTDEGAGRLTQQACSCCHGSGKRPLAREVPPALQQHAAWMAAELDRLVAQIQAVMQRLLR